jgi:hypothetical protein
MNKMKKTYKHITIFYDGVNMHNKKPVYGIFNTKNKDNLGLLYYENNWKQYVFSSADNVIFSVSCLEDIIDFVKNEIK